MYLGDDVTWGYIEFVARIIGDHWNTSLSEDQFKQQQEEYWNVTWNKTFDFPFKGTLKSIIYVNSTKSNN